MRRRHYISAAFELLWPMLLAAGIAAIYDPLNFNKPSSGHKQDSGWQPPTYYNSTNRYIIDKIFVPNPYHHNYTLYFTPENDITTELMNIVQESSDGTTLRPVKDEDTMLKYLIYDQGGDTKIGLVLTGTTATSLKLKIRLKNFMFGESVQMLYPNKYSAGPADETGFDGSAKAYDPERTFDNYYGDFTRAQIAITDAFFTYMCSKKTGCDRRASNTEVIEVLPQEIPYPSYYKSPLASGM